MELEASRSRTCKGSLMATVRFVFTLDYVAEMLEEDVDLLQAIIYNDDNLTCGNILTVVTDDDQTTSALTDDGINELRQMLADAHQSAEKWQEFLECFVDDQQVVERVKTYSPRNNRAVTLEARHRIHIKPSMLA